MALHTYSPFKENAISISNWTKETELTEGDQVFIQLGTSKGLKYSKVDLSDSECLYIYPEGKRNRLYEFFSGVSANEEQLIGIVCSPALLKHLEARQDSLKTAADYNCFLRRNTTKIHIQNHGKLAKAKLSPITGLKDNVSTWMNYAKASLKTNPMIMAFYALALLLVFVMPAMSNKAGITGDEILQHEYSQVILNYYTGNDNVDTVALKSNRFSDAYIAKAKTLGSKLATIEDDGRAMHLYGSSFDTFCSALINTFGVEDIYGFRHKVNSLFGFLIMLFGALIIKRITGSYLYACLGLIILFFTPRILGESYNNPKDIPFAAGYTIAIYYTLLAFSNIRNIRTSHLVGLIVGCALAISIRIGGVLVVAVAVFYAALKYIEDIGWSQFLKLKWTKLMKPVGTVAIVVALSYFIGILLWPWGWDKPMTNPIKALTAFSSYAGSIRQLFEGQLWDSDLLPRYYLIKYILITLPLVSLIGFLVFIVMTIVKRKMSLPVFLVLFAAVFPIVYIYIQKSNVYGGLRHVLFVLPQIIAIALMGWFMMQNFLKSKMPKIGKYAFALPAALTVLPASFIAANHPLEYIYFNETVGGTAGAYGQYEMDYYLAGLRSSTDWLVENKIKQNPDEKITVVSYDPNIVKYYLRDYPNVHVGFARFDDRTGADWKYAIFYNAYMDASRLLNGQYPPKNTIYSPMVDGKPVGVVIEQTDKNGIPANRYLQPTSNRPDSALIYFKEALKSDTNSNEIHYKMAQCYAMLGDIPNMEKHGNAALRIYPEMHVCMYLMAQGYQNAKQFDKAIEKLNNVLVTRPKEAQAFYMLSYCKASKKDMAGSVADIKKAIELQPFNNDFYTFAAQVMNAAGKQAEAQRYQNAIKDVYARDEIYQELTGGEHLQGYEDL